MNVNPPNPNKSLPEEQEGSIAAAESGPLPTSLVAKTAEQLRPYLREQDQAPKAAQIALMVASEFYAGPLPHPEHYGRFEAILPGSANRILRMAEKEQSHRHFQENIQNIYPYVGIVSGLGLAGLCTYFGFELSMREHYTGAALILGVPVLGTIGWFIRARISSAAERKLSIELEANRNASKSKRGRR